MALTRKHTLESRQKMSFAILGNKNHSWKDESAGIEAKHRWVRRNKSKPDHCENCGVAGKRLELAYEDHSAGRHTPEKYKRDINLYHWLCHKCHETLDGRLEKLKKVNIGRKLSLETRRRMGKSIDTRRRMGKAKLGSKNVNFGKHLSPETRRKISESIMRRIRNG
jgi:hypothetical protein